MAPAWNDIFDLPDFQDHFEFIIKKHETLTENLPVQMYPNKIKDKDGENVPKLESVKVVLVHCNLVKNDYQQASKVLFSFVPNKQFGQLINISPHSLTMMNTVNTEFSSVEVWFTDQASKALEIEDNVNLTLIIGWTLQK